MFLVLFLISFFLGLYGLYYEKQNWQKNVQQVQQEAQHILEHSSSKQDYFNKLEEFLRNSGFDLEKADNDLHASKKIFNAGMFLIGFSLMLVGAVAYVIYYFALAPKHRITLPSYQGE